MTHRVQAETGFTLVELLVAIAIIAILAALLFPTISTAKRKVKRTTCLNNVRQINLGVRMYSDDSNDASPSTGSAAASTNAVSLYSGYKALMKSYVGLNGASSPQDKLFACPADTCFPTDLCYENVFLSPSGTRPARGERFKTGHSEVRDSYHFCFFNQEVSLRGKTSRTG